MSSDYLTAHRRFQIKGMADNAEAVIEARKAALEAVVEQELYEKLGNTLADLQLWPSWTVKSVNDSDVRIYTLTTKVVFKP